MNHSYMYVCVILCIHLHPNPGPSVSITRATKWYHDQTRPGPDSAACTVTPSSAFFANCMANWCEDFRESSWSAQWSTRRSAKKRNSSCFAGNHEWSWSPFLVCKVVYSICYISYCYSYHSRIPYKKASNYTVCHQIQNYHSIYTSLKCLKSYTSPIPSPQNASHRRRCPHLGESRADRVLQRAKQYGTVACIRTTNDNTQIHDILEHYL